MIPLSKIYLQMKYPQGFLFQEEIPVMFFKFTIYSEQKKKDFLKKIYKNNGIPGKKGH